MRTNCAGDSITSSGHNLDSDGSCSLGAPGDQVADPQLGPLRDNGGPTETRALLFDGSKAERELGLTYRPIRVALKEAVDDVSLQ